MHLSVYRRVHACVRVDARGGTHPMLIVCTQMKLLTGESDLQRKTGDFTIFPKADKNFKYFECKKKILPQLYCCQETVTRGGFQTMRMKCVCVCVCGFKRNTWGFPPESKVPHLFYLICTIACF